MPSYASFSFLLGCMKEVTFIVNFRSNKKKPKIADTILSQKVRQLVPESQSYMDLLALERKLDSTIARKKLDIQESLKRPMKVSIHLKPMM